MTKKSYNAHMVAIAESSEARNKAIDGYLFDRDWVRTQCFDGVWRWMKVIHGTTYATTESDAVEMQRHLDTTQNGKQRTV